MQLPRSMRRYRACRARDCGCQSRCRSVWYRPRCRAGAGRPHTAARSRGVARVATERPAPFRMAEASPFGSGGIARAAVGRVRRCALDFTAADSGPGRAGDAGSGHQGARACRAVARCWGAPRQWGTLAAGLATAAVQGRSPRPPRDRGRAAWAPDPTAARRTPVASPPWRRPAWQRR